MNLLIIPILAILNMIRGSGNLKRVVFYALIMGSITYFFNNWLFALIWTCGLALFFAAPWGNGFLVVHGQDTRHYDRSDKWLVELVDILTNSTSKVMVGVLHGIFKTRGSVRCGDSSTCLSEVRTSCQL